MSNLDSIRDTMQQTFSRIHVENMQGIPILNPVIEVEALGFQVWQGRVLGVIITPWLMNMVLLPAEGEDWSQMPLGHKQQHEFPSRSYTFMINDIEGIGICQTYSMCSPMHEFESHEQAVQVAQDFLDGLMVETRATEEDLVNEELLGRVMRGEDTSDIDLSQFDEIEPVQAESTTDLEQVDTQVTLEKKLSRRDLLRGNLAG